MPKGCLAPEETELSKAQDALSERFDWVCCDVEELSGMMVDAEMPQELVDEMDKLAGQISTMSGKTWEITNGKRCGEKSC